MGIDIACLVGNKNEVLSYDNLFHSVLGLMDINTQLYQADLAFSSCRAQ
jgi:lipid A ethanolaminephosphotransferase